MRQDEIEPVFRIAWVTVRFKLNRLHGENIDEWPEDRKERVREAYRKQIAQMDLEDAGGLRRAADIAKALIGIEWNSGRLVTTGGDL